MPDQHPLADQIRHAIADPHAVVGNRLSSTAWAEDETGHVPGDVEESLTDWMTRAVLAVLAEADRSGRQVEDERTARRNAIAAALVRHMGASAAEADRG